jgi:hypothetical protein
MVAAFVVGVNWKRWWIVMLFSDSRQPSWHRQQSEQMENAFLLINPSNLAPS